MTTKSWEAVRQDSRGRGYLAHLFLGTMVTHRLWAERVITRFTMVTHRLMAELLRDCLVPTSLLALICTQIDEAIRGIDEIEPSAGAAAVQLTAAPCEDGAAPPAAAHGAGLVGELQTHLRRFSRELHAYQGRLQDLQARACERARPASASTPPGKSARARGGGSDGLTQQLTGARCDGLTHGGKLASSGGNDGLTQQLARARRDVDAARSKAEAAHSRAASAEAAQRGAELRAAEADAARGAACAQLQRALDELRGELRAALQQRHDTQQQFEAATAAAQQQQQQVKEYQ